MSQEPDQGQGDSQGQSTKVKGHINFKCLHDLVGYLIDMNVPDRFLESCKETFKDLPLVLEDLQPIEELEWDHVTDIGQTQPGQGQNGMTITLAEDESILSLLSNHVTLNQPMGKEIQNETALLANRNASSEFDVPNYNGCSPEPITSQIFTKLCSEATPEIPTMQQETVTQQIFGDLCSKVVNSELSQESIKTLTNSNQNLATTMQSHESLKTLTNSNQNLTLVTTITTTTATTTSINRSTSYQGATSDLNSLYYEANLPLTVTNRNTIEEDFVEPACNSHFPSTTTTHQRPHLDYVIPYNEPPPYVRPPPVEDGGGGKPASKERPPFNKQRSIGKMKVSNSSNQYQLSSFEKSKVEHPCNGRSPCHDRPSPDSILSDIPTDEDSFKPNVLTHVRLPTPERLERPGTLNLGNGRKNGGESGDGSSPNLSIHSSSTVGSNTLQMYYNHAPISPNETLV